MAAIYSRAKHVLIWPGPLPYKMRGIRAVSKFLRAAKWISDDLYWECSGRVYLYYLMFEMRGLQYWRRLWIIQEVILAKQVFLVTGMKLVHWTDLTQLEGSNVGAISDSDQTGQKAIKALMRNRGDLKSRGHTFSELLPSYYRSECSDRRDRVFGMMGLLKEEAALTVDYALNCASLFTRAFILYAPNCLHTMNLFQSALAPALGVVPLFFCPHRLEEHPLRDRGLLPGSESAGRQPLKLYFAVFEIPPIVDSAIIKLEFFDFEGVLCPSCKAVCLHYFKSVPGRGCHDGYCEVLECPIPSAVWLGISPGWRKGLERRRVYEEQNGLEMSPDDKLTGPLPNDWVDSNEKGLPKPISSSMTEG